MKETDARYGDCSWNIREIVGDLVLEGLVEEGDGENGKGRVLRIRGDHALCFRQCIPFSRLASRRIPKEPMGIFPDTS